MPLPVINASSAQYTTEEDALRAALSFQEQADNNLKAHRKFGKQRAKTKVDSSKVHDGILVEDVGSEAECESMLRATRSSSSPKQKSGQGRTQASSIESTGDGGNVSSEERGTSIVQESNASGFKPEASSMAPTSPTPTTPSEIAPSVASRRYVADWQKWLILASFEMRRVICRELQINLEVVIDQLEQLREWAVLAQCVDDV